MKTIEEIKEFLVDSIDEMNGYIEDENNGYDYIERHDCKIAKEVFEHILNFINKKEAANMNNRLNSIAAFAQRRDEDIANRRQQAIDKEEYLKKTILGQSDRINQLIDTANACVKHGIKFYTNSANRCHYDDGHFVTDSWCHSLGFEFNHCRPSVITRIGKMGGGACNFDVYTDGKTITATGSDRLWALSRFVEDFNEFETKFYAYVDKICQSK